MVDRESLPKLSLGLSDSWHQKACVDCGETGVLLDTNSHEFGVRECDSCGSMFDILESGG